LGLSILPLKEIVSKSSMTILLLLFLEEENHVEPTNDVEALLHIVPFCEGKNKKPEGFAKQKQPAIFVM
jgi:hypothetical protein